jgi:hypothetical protein
LELVDPGSEGRRGGGRVRAPDKRPDHQESDPEYAQQQVVRGDPKPDDLSGEENCDYQRQLVDRARNDHVTLPPQCGSSPATRCAGGGKSLLDVFHGRGFFAEHQSHGAGSTAQRVPFVAAAPLQKELRQRQVRLALRDLIVGRASARGDLR